jgi:hypothetical protein
MKIVVTLVRQNIQIPFLGRLQQTYKRELSKS